MFGLFGVHAQPGNIAFPSRNVCSWRGIGALVLMASHASQHLTLSSLRSHVAFYVICELVLCKNHRGV